MIVASRVRNGDYRDSIQLMQLQAGLEELPGVAAAVAMMATAENQALLRDGGWPVETAGLGAADLYVAVRADSQGLAEEAFAAVERLLAGRGAGDVSDYRPRSLEAAVKQLPSARWVLISTPGAHAVGLARRALELGRNVHLFSDHVSLSDEAALKREARRRGLLLMGPDCGTAIVNGTALAFANRVRRGPIGLIGSSGTGLQSLSCRIHALKGGVSHALGVGGRDMADEVGASSTEQALDLLARDHETRVVALVSKPPGPKTAARLVARLRSFAKPVAACFLGYAAPARRMGALHFAANLPELAELALELELEVQGPRSQGQGSRDGDRDGDRVGGGRRWLRGLFSGGTLAGEALQRLGASLNPVYSNLSSAVALPLADPERSQGHTVIDLGDDAFTRGRPHPMIDPEPVFRRLEREASDPETAVALFDVVLGYGAHPDPAAKLAPVIARHRGSGVEFFALIVGAEDDPQNAKTQARRLEEAGASVFTDQRELFERIEDSLAEIPPPPEPPVPLEALHDPTAVINVGLESFYESLRAQGAEAVHVDWKPPAGGDPTLAALLERMKQS